MLIPQLSINVQTIPSIRLLTQRLVVRYTSGVDECVIPAFGTAWLSAELTRSRV